MTEVTETAQEQEQEKGQSAVLKAAGVGMALLGSSTAGTTLAGGSAAHVDHGHTVARWWGVSISMLGWLIGGTLYVFAPVPAVVIGAALQVVALITTLALNAAGYGRPDLWGELKAKAAAERASA